MLAGCLPFHPLFLHLLTYIQFCLSLARSFCLSLFLPFCYCLFFLLSLFSYCLHVFMSLCQSFCLSVSLSVFLFICFYVCLSVLPSSFSDAFFRQQTFGTTFNPYHSIAKSKMSLNSIYTNESTKNLNNHKVNYHYCFISANA